MAALDRAVALAERRDVAVLVGEELDLDVARPVEIALAEDRVVAERRRCLAARRRERFVELLGCAYDAHPAPAAARGRLDEQREADLLRRPARQDGHAGRARGLLGGQLVAPGSQRGRRRADPGQSRVEHGLRQLGALGEEAVAGMDGVGAGLPRGAHVLGRVEVGRDLDERVRRLGVERTAVVGSRDRDRLDVPRPGRRGRCGARSPHGWRRAGGAWSRV